MIERLERRIAELEGQAKPGAPPRMPGLKPSFGPPASDAAAAQKAATPRLRPSVYDVVSGHRPSAVLSVGAIVSAIHRTAQRAQPAVAAILDRIRASPVVHADETGWRQSGANGYVWTFSTP